MSEPPTLLIPEIDEERTFIETRNAGLDGFPTKLGDMHAPSPQAGSGCTETLSDVSSMRRLFGRRRYAEGIVVFGLISGLAFVGYQQWRIAESILRSMGELSEAELINSNHEARPLPERVPLGFESASDSKFMSPDTQEVGIHRLESVGAALIRANDFEAALNHYRALARALPGERVFRDLVFVLQSKLRCEHSLSPTNVGCP